MSPLVALLVDLHAHNLPAYALATVASVLGAAGVLGCLAGVARLAVGGLLGASRRER